MFAVAPLHTGHAAEPASPGIQRAEAGPVPLGLGAYATTLRAGGEREPPPARWRGGNAPVPSNQWYSSLLFSTWSQPLFAQPLSYLCDPEGFQLGVPEKTVSPHAGREENDIVYPHRAALVLKPLGFAMHDARAGKISDWALDIVMGDGKQALTATIAHGSPFGYYQVSQGDIKITSADAAGSIFHRDQQANIIGVRVHGKPYAIFLPEGASWREAPLATTAAPAAPPITLTLHLPPGRGYFSIAALPDTQQRTIAEFAKYAYAFITDSQVDWQYDEAGSSVTSTFRLSTRAMQGGERGTLIALYPHQWHDNTSLPPLLPYQYPSVRGALKLFAGQQFQVKNSYHGLMPFWPGLSGARQGKKLAQFLDADLRAGPEAVLGHGGTYWEGKGLGRATQLMIIAEQQGDMAKRDALLAAIKTRMETWLRATPDGAQYFYLNRDLGTLIGYPDEYGSASELNDHHFHYGYWIFAAAQIALRDPQWASKKQWGGMIEMLIGDIANAERGNPMFPFLRPFDAYESHSWASGTAPFYDGNNQESSSEAIHAWAGLILWGEATGNKKLRDTGIFLYTGEIAAANHYWFDLHGQVFASEYQNKHAGIVWGNKYVHGTWFTEDPREIQGINILPVTTASLYLGRDTDFIKASAAATDGEFAKYLKSQRDSHVSGQIWQDILLEYLAIADPQAAMAQWDQYGMVEQGESSSHTYHWIASLADFGQPHFGVTANTPLYAVFRQADGRLVYMAYNGGDQAKQVRFSDGMVLTVPAHGLARGAGADGCCRMPRPS